MKMKTTIKQQKDIEDTHPQTDQHTNTLACMDVLILLYNNGYDTRALVKQK